MIVSKIPLEPRAFAWSLSATLPLSFLTAIVMALCGAPPANAQSVQNQRAIYVYTEHLAVDGPQVSTLRLPAEILTSPCTTNAITTWLGAGYRPSLLLSAWDKITNSFQTYFPQKVFTLPIIPVASGGTNTDYPFPQIDDSGCVYSPTPVTTDFGVVYKMVARNQ